MGISADYFDGRTSKRFPVSIHLDDGLLHVDGEITFAVPVAAIRPRPRLGQTPIRLELPGGGLLVGSDLAQVVDRLPVAPEALPHRLESHLGVVFLALVALPLIAWAVYRQTIPWIARVAVARLPQSIELRIGTEGLETLDRRLMGPTELDATRRDRLADVFAGLRASATLPQATLEHRAGGALGANAFALPGGIVIVTDQLADELDDEQVAAVLAHELGHVAHRHGMRALFQTSVLVLLSNMVLGDAGGVTVMAASVPAMLANLRYSRDHEAEADAYAFGLLRATGRSPATLAEAFTALERSHGSAPDSLRYLSTHPPTEERVRSAREAAVR